MSVVVELNPFIFFFTLVIEYLPAEMKERLTQIKELDSQVQSK